MTTKKELIEKIKNTFVWYAIPRQLNKYTKKDLEYLYNKGIELKLNERPKEKTKVTICI